MNIETTEPEATAIDDRDEHGRRIIKEAIEDVVAQREKLWMQREKAMKEVEVLARSELRKVVGAQLKERMDVVIGEVKAYRVVTAKERTRFATEIAELQVIDVPPSA